jgi:hypothetical protein
MALTLVTNNDRPIELERMIEETREQVNKAKEAIDLLYNAVNMGIIEEEKCFRTNIINTRKINYDFKSAEEIIADYYPSDSQDFKPSEFKEVYMALAFGLTEICAQYLKEQTQNPKQIEDIEDTFSDFIHCSIQELYPDPRDLILEYEKMRIWHNQSDDSVKEKVMSYFIEYLCEHANNSQRYKLLISTKEKLEEELTHLSTSEEKAERIEKYTSFVR